MRRYFALWLLGILGMAGNVAGQVGEKVPVVKVLNMDNESVNLPYLGQKNLLIFYADPGRPRQNKNFRDYFKEHPITGSDIASYGVINMAAAPMIPNSLIRKMALKEVKGTDAQLYMDPDHVLSEAWKLPDADNNFAIIVVNKEGVIQFYKAGQLTAEEQQQVLQLLKSYAKD